MCELSAIQNAAHDGHCLTSSEEDRAQVSVGIHTGEVPRFVDVSAELRMNRSGMAVLMLLPKIRNQFAHDVQKIVLEILQIKRIDVVRTFLHHDRAGCVVGGDADGSVPDAGCLDNFNHFFRHVVKSGNPAPRLQFQFFLVNLEIHGFLLFYFLSF